MQKKIVLIIATAALLLFVIGLVAAFQIVLSNDPDDVKNVKVKYFNEHYWTVIIVSVNGLLIVNLSSLLGIPLFRKEEITIRQWFALVYLVLLLVIFLFWGWQGFNEAENMPVIIPQLSKSFFALLLAALGMILKEMPVNKPDK